MPPISLSLPAPPYERVVAGSTVESVGRAVAGDHVGERVAFSLGDPPAEDEILDSRCKRVSAHPRLDRVEAAIRRLPDPVAQGIHHIAIVARTAHERVVAAAADQRVAPRAAQQCVVAAAAIQPVAACAAGEPVGGIVARHRLRRRLARPSGDRRVFRKRRALHFEWPGRAGKRKGERRRQRSRAGHGRKGVGIGLIARRAEEHVEAGPDERANGGAPAIRARLARVGPNRQPDGIGHGLTLLIRTSFPKLYYNIC